MFDSTVKRKLAVWWATGITILVGLGATFLLLAELFHLVLSGVVLCLWIANRKPSVKEAAFVGACCGGLTTVLWAFSLGDVQPTSASVMRILTLLFDSVPIVVLWSLGTMLLCFIFGISHWSRKGPSN